MPRGFSLIELLVVIGIMIVLSSFSFLSLRGFRDTQDIEDTAMEIVSALHAAREKSLTAEDESLWGVHFVNSATGTDSYEIFKGSAYAPSEVVQTISLRTTADFLIPPSGASADVTFNQVTGYPQVSSIIRVSGTVSTTTVYKITVDNLGIITSVKE